MSNSLVSIILPAYNAEQFLNETINSVINQTYPNWELLIINDGSKDNTESLSKKWVVKDQRIKYISKTNSGVSDTRNTGIENANGEYLFFLDADDVWLPNNIQEKLNQFASNRYAAIYSACELINEQSISLNKFLYGSEEIRVEDVLQLKGNYITAPSGLAVKTEVYKLIGGFDIKLSNNADQDFFLRILAGGYHIGYVKEPLWKYRMHNSNMSKNISLLEKDILYMFNKAESNNFFKTINFKKQCFAKVYFTLAGSWWKNGNNKLRGIYFIFKAIFSYPPIIIYYLRK